MTRTQLKRVALLTCTSRDALIRATGAAYKSDGTQRRSHVSKDVVHPYEIARGYGR